MRFYNPWQKDADPIALCLGWDSVTGFSQLMSCSPGDDSMNIGEPSGMSACHGQVGRGSRVDTVVASDV